jgi:formate-nitrite transporter family protein
MGKRATESNKNDSRDIEEHARLPARTVYEIVRQEGLEQMDRPAISLWWSGFAAGLSISFSLVSQAVLMHLLPRETWSPLVADFGYSVGFLIVVLGRQQLFTETTITVILPLLAHFTQRNLLRSMRMWAIVLTANFVGTFLAAAFFAFTPAMGSDLRGAMVEISQHTMTFGWWEMLFRGIPAGFLIAVMVWLIPSAESNQFQVITVLTYLIAIGGFAHIVAGSMEAFTLVLKGNASLYQAIWGFIAPVLIGNVIGGTALFGMISYGQVMKEI